MTKKRAYTSPTGKEMISAQQVKEYRARYNDQPYPYPLYSTHAPGLRKRVYHNKKGSSYFAFNPDGSGGSAASDGETLNHLLFKETLSGLKHTRLALYKPGKNKDPDFWTNAFVTICSSTEQEKMISRDDVPNPLFADVYLKFESEHWIAEKWSGEVYVEVFNTHAVGIEKQKVLKRLELPTIEVDIRKPPYAYAVDDDDTTDEQEAAHVHRLRRMLEHDNGFLRAIVLSNPSSAPYLKKRLTQQIEQTNQIKAELDATKSELRIATQDKLSAEDAMERLQADVTSLRTEKTELTKGLQASLSEQHELTGAHNSLRQAHVDLTEQHKSARHSLHIRYVLAIVFIVTVFTGFDFFWRTDEPVSTDLASTTPPMAETPQAPPSTDKPRAKSHVRRSHGH